MKKYFFQLMAVIVAALLICPISVWAVEEESKAGESEISIGIEAPHAILMEASTGRVLYGKNENQNHYGGNFKHHKEGTDNRNGT